MGAAGAACLAACGLQAGTCVGVLARHSCEATVLGDTGLPDFQALRHELRNPQSKRLIYHAFDLLYLDGRDLRRVPLLQRKDALKSLLEDGPAALVYVDFLEADGTRV